MRSPNELGDVPHYGRLLLDPIFQYQECQSTSFGDRQLWQRYLVDPGLDLYLDASIVQTISMLPV